jgi:hypothetical protein
MFKIKVTNILTSYMSIVMLGVTSEDGPSFLLTDYKYRHEKGTWKGRTILFIILFARIVLLIYVQIHMIWELSVVIMHKEMRVCKFSNYDFPKPKNKSIIEFCLDKSQCSGCYSDLLQEIICWYGWEVSRIILAVMKRIVSTMNRTPIIQFVGAFL